MNASHTLLERTEGEPIRFDCDGFEVWLHSQASPDHPQRNEDGIGIWLLDEGCLVAAIADGMGGTPLGAEAAAIAIGSLDSRIGQAREGGLRAVVLDAFEAANREIQERVAGSGSTLVVCEVAEGRVRTYNVGDSAAMLVGQRGRMKMQTLSHSPVGYGVEAGLIAVDAARTHEDRHYLSNHLGSVEMFIEVGSDRSVAARDTLLLASDGLLDNLSEEEIVETIRCGPLEQAATTLAHEGRKHMARHDGPAPGKPDDLSFILVREQRRP